MAMLNQFWMFLRSSSSRIILATGTLLIFISSVKASDNKLINFPSIPIDGDTVLSFSVKPEGDILLPFVTSQVSEIGTKVQLFLSDFRDKYGNTVAVNPFIVELPSLKPINQRLSFILSDSIRTLKLKIPELPSEGKFKANLIILKSDGVEQINTIIVTRAIVQQLAQLTTDLKSIDIHNTNSFTILVRNDSPDWEAKGIFLRLLEVTTPKGTEFDPGKNLSFKWNDVDVSDIWYSTSAENKDTAQRVITTNQQAKISGEFVGLKAGEYTIKLGIAAVNGITENEQQVTLKVKVRDNIWNAVLFLFIGILVAFTTNKVLVTLNSRSETSKRIEQIRRSPSLGDVAYSLPVICIRVILKQVENRNRNIIVALGTSYDVIKERLDRAENILKIVDRGRILREKIENWTDDRMIKYRAKRQLRKIEADLDWETGDVKFLDEVKSKLDVLEQWDNTDQRYILFWNELKPDIEKMRVLAKPEDFGFSKKDNEQDWVKVDKLQDELSKEKDLDDKIKLGINENVRKRIVDISHIYAKLKLLWECKENDDENLLNGLLKSIEGDPVRFPVEDLWKMTDNNTWEKIKEACELKEKTLTKENGKEAKEFKQGMEFTLPHRNEIQPKRIFELIQFKILPKDNRLAYNYLFRYGLQFIWTLKLKDKWLTNPITNEPRLVQYFPVRGKDYNIGVKLRYKGDESKVIKMDPLEIKISSDFGFIGGFQTVEIIPALLAMVFAILSGLQANYINNPTFGTLGDYITLFLWGAAVDVGKNFIQYYQQIRKGGSTT